MAGTWTTQPYEIVDVDGGDVVRIQPGPDAIMVIDRQHFCHLEGTVTWVHGNSAHDEKIVGVLHSDGELITILGIGEHPDQSTRAYIHGSLVAPGKLHWDFVGISDDRQRGQAFSAIFAKDNTAPHRDTCPTLIGNWSSGNWEGLTATSDGAHERIKHGFSSLQVEGQSGCIVWGKMAYGSEGVGQDSHSDRFIGVINDEKKLLITRSVAPHPEDGYEAIALHRLDAENQLVTEYTGELASGAGSFVYLLGLQRH